MQSSLSIIKEAMRFIFWPIKKKSCKYSIISLKNAIQAIPKNKEGVIRISLIVEKHRVKVGIADNGTGIPLLMKDKLFQPNFTTKTSGTGLGLAIAKTIIEDFKGSIEVESEQGKGATFYLIFPELEG
jgi:signal transduction histidine kinase